MHACILNWSIFLCCLQGGLQDVQIVTQAHGHLLQCPETSQEAGRKHLLILST